MAETKNQKRRYRSPSMANATCEHKLLWEDCPQCAEFTPNADAILGPRASQSWIATECRCLKCGETFIESDPNPIHWGREDGAECGGKGEIVGSWR